MNPKSTFCGVCLLTAATALLAALPASAQKPTGTPGSPNADQLLRQMSAKLAVAKTFSFEATREIDPALLGGRDVPEKARVTVNVQRPNKIAARAESDAGARRLVFDGTALWLSDEKLNHYATVPMPTTIDGLVAKLDQKYGFTPPLAEFALSNLYQDLRRQAQTVTYLGLGTTTDGVECHKLALKGKEADAELWIAVSDQLPRKLVATFKNREGNPQVRIDFLSWNLAASLTAADFTFTPAKDAEKIEMLTTAQMQAIGKP